MCFHGDGFNNINFRNVDCLTINYKRLKISQGRQDQQDKENIAQGSKEKGDALGKVDNTFYRPSS